MIKQPLLAMLFYHANGTRVPMVPFVWYTCTYHVTIGTVVVHVYVQI